MYPYRAGDADVLSFGAVAGLPYPMFAGCAGESLQHLPSFSFLLLLLLSASVWRELSLLAFLLLSFIHSLQQAQIRSSVARSAGQCQKWVSR